MQTKLAYVRFATSFIASALLGRRSLTCLWELTYRCNARCAFCAYWRRPSHPRDEMTLPEVQEGLERIYRHGCRFVNFTGGEPTVRRDLEAIVAHASRLGMWTSLVTNGGLLTRERLRALKAAGLDSLMISLDSPDAATHDGIRGVHGLHQRVLENMEAVATEFMTGLHIGGLMCVIARHNVGDLDRVLALAEGLGVYVLFQPYHDRKTGSRDFLADIPPSLKARLGTAAHPRRILLNSPNYLAGMARHASGQALPACHAGAKYFSIDPFGYLHPCVDLPAAGHLLRDPIDVVHGEQACANVAKCSGCWYCFRGEADSSLRVSGWLDRLALGVSVARRNFGRQRAAAPGRAGGTVLPTVHPWTPRP